MLKLKKSKLVQMLMIVALSFSLLFSGCGKSSDTAASRSTPEDKSTNVAQSTAEASGLSPYEIKWYTIGTPQKDIDKVMEELSKYTKEKINATIKMTQFDWGEYEKKMNVIIASGEKFDIAFTCSWALNYEMNAAKGSFLAVDELLDKYGKGIKEVMNPMFIDGNKINGKLYAIPVNKEITQQRRFMFNKNLVDKYKFDVSKPMKLADLEPMLTTIKQNEKDILNIINCDMGNAPSLDKDGEYIAGDEKIPLRVWYDDTSLKVVNMLEDTTILDNYKTLRKYYKAGFIKKDAATATMLDPIKSDRWFTGYGDWIPNADALWSRTYKAPVVTTAQRVDPYVTNGSISGSMMAISAASKNPERAMMFLNLLNTDKYVRNLVDSGLEGVHYKMEGDRQVDLEKGTSDYNMPTFSLGNRFILNLFKDDPADLWDQYKKFNDTAKPSSLLGFKPNLEGLKTELGALTNVAAEFSGLKFGMLDPDVYVKKFNDKLKAQGLDKVQAELQKQVDAWKASKK